MHLHSAGTLRKKKNNPKQNKKPSGNNNDDKKNNNNDNNWLSSLHYMMMRRKVHGRPAKAMLGAVLEGRCGRQMTSHLVVRPASLAAAEDEESALLPTHSLSLSPSGVHSGPYRPTNQLSPSLPPPLSLSLPLPPLLRKKLQLYMAGRFLRP